MRVKRIFTSRWTAALVATFAFNAVFGCETRITTSDTQRFNPYSAPDLEVLVLDMNDAVVPGATVSLYERAGNGAQRVAKGETDANGIVTFIDPAEGQYLLYARKEGYIGTSAFAQVQRTGVVVGTLRMRPITSLADASVGVIDQSGGTVTTVAVPTLPQSAITFDGSSFTSSTTVIIATVANNQIPSPPPGQIALGAIVLESTNPLSGSATVAVGLPFDLPAGTSIPLFAYNDITGEWTQVAVGSVDPVTGQVTAQIDDMALVSALAGFVPQRVSATISTPVGPPRTLGPGDPVEIKLVYTPTLVFPEGSNYTAKTQEWLKGVMGSIIGQEFGREVTLTVKRDPSTIQTYWVYDNIDDYIISINVGGSKPAAVAKVAAAYQFQSRSMTRSQELRAVEHNSGTGGGS